MKRSVLLHALRGAVVGALVMTSMASGPVLAGSSFVDPDSLLPPPPPGAVCMAVGAGTVRCDTFKDFDLDHERVFDVPCGPVYETSADHRDGIRWYQDSLLVKRHVDADLHGFWSTSPTATDSGVHLFAAWASTSSWTVPGDDATVQERLQGVLGRVLGPTGAPIISIAGQDDLDGTHHGVSRDLDLEAGIGPAWPALVAALCG